MRKLLFDTCFPPKKVSELAALLPETYQALNELAPWRKGKWPVHVRCLSNKRIVEGRSRGAGHGMTYVEGNEIWLNPHMTLPGYWLVFVHENLHHAFPDATEDELNKVLLPEVYRLTFGEKLDMEWAKKHGVGPPCPWGDRGFVGTEVPKVCK